MKQEKIKILYIDDERNNLVSFKASFRLDYNVFTATSGEEGLEILNNNPDIQIIFSDQKMPSETGVEFFARIQNIHSKPIRILITAYADIESVISAINNGHVFRYVKKPWSEDDIHSSVAEAYSMYKNQSRPIDNISATIPVQENLQTINDNPIDLQEFINNRIRITDKIHATLNVKKQAKEFSTLLTSLSFDEGMMVGLFGRWGRGKTFFWRQVWSILSNEANNQFYKAEFHAWKYQDTPASWAYLYEVLAKCYLNKPNKISIAYIPYYYRVFLLNIQRKGKLPLLKSILIILFGAFLFLIIRHIAATNSPESNQLTLLIGAPLTILLTTYQLAVFLKKEYSHLAKDIFTQYTHKHSFKTELGIQAEIQKEIVNLLKVWVPTRDLGKKRILVFVDDIDRCNEGKIIEIIDALRVMLDNTDLSKRLVVLAAVDERVLKRVISNKYYDILSKDFDDEKEYKKINLEELVREYMDKLFIAGIKLNNLSNEGRKAIVSSIAKGKIKSPNEQLIIQGNQKFIKTPTMFVPIEEFIEKSKIEDDDTVDVAESELQKNEDPREFELTETEYESLLEIINHYQNATPRSIRIFYYRYLLAKRFWAIHTSTLPDIEKEWYRRGMDQSILPYLILECTVKKINSYLDLKLSEDVDDYIEIDFITRKIVAKKILVIEILKIVEIVIPY